MKGWFFMKGIIIYASKYGCTERAVKLLQSKITQGIKAVNITKEKAPDLSLYDTVILGGPIYIGKMHKAMSAYMQKNCEALKKKRLALFVCAGEQDPAIAQKQLISAFPKELYDNAVMCEIVGGELEWDKLDFMTKLMLRIVKGIKEGYSRLSQEKIDRLAKGVLLAQNKLEVVRAVSLPKAK
jgi:menaquinone-dependent protoporphyrinogen oxidase